MPYGSLPLFTCPYCRRGGVGDLALDLDAAMRFRRDPAMGVCLNHYPHADLLVFGPDTIGREPCEHLVCLGLSVITKVREPRRMRREFSVRWLHPTLLHSPRMRPAMIENWKIGLFDSEAKSAHHYAILDSGEDAVELHGCVVSFDVEIHILLAADSEAYLDELADCWDRRHYA